MTDVRQAGRPQPWGYWATAGWAIVGAVVSSLAALAVVVLLRPDALDAEIDILKDGLLISVSSIATALSLVAVLTLAAWLARWPAAEYLGLVMPARRDVVRAFAALIPFLLAYDAMTWLLGRDIISQFQVDAYTSAKASGALTLLWIAIVVTAPVSEEIVFRGFLFRGWVRSPRGAWAGILIIAALFAIIHIQYNWYEMLQVFLVGTLLTWTRWWSGSTLLTMMMHAAVNLWAMLQTAAKLDWFA
jgi:membrane protease YdiL (CAAX protease family)